MVDIFVVLTKEFFHQQLMFGPNPDGPRSVSWRARAIKYSGFLGVREKWVGPLEIS